MLQLKTNNGLENCYTIKEVANILHWKSEKTVINWIKKGRFKTVLHNNGYNRIFIPLSSFKFKLTKKELKKLGG